MKSMTTAGCFCGLVLSFVVGSCLGAGNALAGNPDSGLVLRPTPEVLRIEIEMDSIVDNTWPKGHRFAGDVSLRAELRYDATGARHLGVDIYGLPEARLTVFVDDVPYVAQQLAFNFTPVFVSAFGFVFDDAAFEVEFAFALDERAQSALLNAAEFQSTLAIQDSESSLFFVRGADGELVGGTSWDILEVQGGSGGIEFPVTRPGELSSSVLEIWNPSEDVVELLGVEVDSPSGAFDLESLNLSPIPAGELRRLHVVFVPKTELEDLSGEVRVTTRTGTSTMSLLGRQRSVSAVLSPTPDDARFRAVASGVSEAFPEGHPFANFDEAEVQVSYDPAGATFADGRYSLPATKLTMGTHRLRNVTLELTRDQFYFSGVGVTEEVEFVAGLGVTAPFISRGLLPNFDDFLIASGAAANGHEIVIREGGHEFRGPTTSFDVLRNTFPLNPKIRCLPTRRGTTTTTILEIKNSGSTPLVLSGIELDPPSEAFSVDATNATIAVGETLRRDIAFAPKALGDDSATVRVQFASEPSQSLPVVGEAISSHTELRPTPPSIRIDARVEEITENGWPVGHPLHRTEAQEELATSLLYDAGGATYSDEGDVYTLPLAEFRLDGEVLSDVRVRVLAARMDVFARGSSRGVPFEARLGLIRDDPTDSAALFDAEDFAALLASEGARVELIVRRDDGVPGQLTGRLDVGTAVLGDADRLVRARSTPLGRTSQAVIEIVHRGEMELEITSIEASGEVSIDGSSAVVPPCSTFRRALSFAPVEAGVRSGTLVVHYADQESQTIEVVGSGVQTIFVRPTPPVVRVRAQIEDAVVNTFPESHPFHGLDGDAAGELRYDAASAEFLGGGTYSLPASEIRFTTRKGEWLLFAVRLQVTPKSLVFSGRAEVAGATVDVDIGVDIFQSDVLLPLVLPAPSEFDRIASVVGPKSQWLTLRGAGEFTGIVNWD
ncbi:MAG: choice-of-anchor D domain-containing protein, partial [Planctomycetota bacterium]